ncbi:MAG: hypothetical protein IKU37_01525 [Candidatus Gastranaerophilales bacterium]|nr:hypothetical protein [Candidatus Gastranaerophilales bacterium]
MAKWKRMNKTMAIIKHLEKYGYIDTWTAIKEYGATRLSAIIYNLRHNYNMNIINQEIGFKDRYGNNASYVRYILVKERGADYE